MDIAEFLLKWWPLISAVVIVIVMISKLDVRISVVEDKVKTLFHLWNNK